jgi:hypothetical protein
MKCQSKLNLMAAGAIALMFFGASAFYPFMAGS